MLQANVPRLCSFRWLSNVAASPGWLTRAARHEWAFLALRRRLVRVMELRRGRVASVLFEVITGAQDIIGQDPCDLPIKVRANDDPQAVDFLGVRRHGVCGQYPTAFAHLVRDIELV